MAPFPQTGQLTLFEGPAENPLSESGAWAQTYRLRAPLRKEAGTPYGSATDSSHGDPNYSSWVRETFNSNSIVEVWACTAGGQLGAELETWRVTLLTDINNFSGYLAYYGGGISKGFAIRKYTDFVFTDIAASAALPYPERLGLRIDGPNVECWGMDAGVWSLKCSVADPDYRGEFWIGLGIEDPSGGGLGFPCFGGGRVNRTQIYRVVRGAT